MMVENQDTFSQLLDEKTIRHQAKTHLFQNSNLINKIDDAGSPNSKHAVIKSILKSKSLFGGSNEELSGSKRSFGQKSQVPRFQDSQMPGLTNTKS